MASGCFSDKRRGILAVLPSFSGGGAERVIVTLANELRDRVRPIHISVFCNSGPIAALVSNGIQLHVCGKGKLRNSLLPQLQLLRELRPSVVLSTFGYVNLALLLLKPLFPSNTKLWVREANLPSLSLPRNKYYRLVRFGYSVLYPRADLLICSSDRMREEFASDYGISGARMRVLPNPVDEEAIRESARLPARNPGKGIQFVASGRLTTQKGFDNLLEMFAKLGDETARLTILGDGPLAVELRSQAHRLGILERVCFLGYKENPWPYYAGADAFVLPSRWEGMSNAVLEALACGVPVIATPEAGGIDELVTEAAPGAVTVAESGRPFIEAMRLVRHSNPFSLRPSLLPQRYRMESVVDTFEKWLEEDD